MNIDYPVIENGGHIYLFLEDFLPGELYSACVRFWPDDKYFVGNGTRKRIVRSGLPALPANLSGFWREFADYVNGSVKPALVQRFLPFLHKKFIGLPSEKESWARSNFEIFNHDNEGLNLDRNYAITPHVDQKYIFISCLLYMPKDGFQKNLGTSFYKAEDSTFRTVDVEYPPADLFKESMSFPFKPNSLLAFLQTPTSFHGKRNVRHWRPRRTYQFNVTFTPRWVEHVYGDTTPY